MAGRERTAIARLRGCGGGPSPFSQRSWRFSQFSLARSAPIWAVRYSMLVSTMRRL